MNHRTLPALRGGFIALTAAVLFGISTPMVQRFGTGIGSFTTSASSGASTTRCRTGSVFAFAPFVGAMFAFLLGERSGTGWMLAGAALMILGIVLHLTESHAHEHEPLWHSHAHGPDEHHTHRH